MSSEPLRVGVVGCGFQGRLHLECYSALPDVVVAGVYDVDEERARGAAESYGTNAHASLERLLADERLDLLSVCTMPNTHRAITLAALDAGAHVLCEKPFARHADDALAMADAAERAGLILSVGFNMRHMAAAQSVYQFVQTDDFGKPVCARGWMLSEEIPWWGKHYVRSISGGGALAATAVHMIDLLIWLAGNPTPVTATASMAKMFPRKRGRSAPSDEAAASYDTEDLVFGHVRFENGFWISIEGAWVWDNPGSGWDYSFDLVGDRGHARLSPLRLITESEGELRDRPSAMGGEFDFPSSTRAEIADVLSAIREGRAPLITAKEALVVQRVVDALYRSAELGHEVEIGAAER